MITQELESTKMTTNESFADFIKRWRGKGSNFETFFESRLAIVEALQIGVLLKSEFSSSTSTQKAKPRAYIGNNTALFGSNNYANATSSGNNAATQNSNHVVDVNQVQAPPKSRNQNQHQSFANFEASLSSVMEKLVKFGHLRPLTLTPLPQNPPPSHSPNVFCAYHQMSGHHTNSCYRLPHAIQDLIDDGTLATPLSKPNVISNSMPKHNPNLQINHISLSST
ncbi:hypothetical protein RHMOL_Rhmol03G0128900 [Rhododendron molle]|uniref:Uncharacterized protein n=1 Tax=Rhododendron molle TaxID=49168 RepID=A0ACC0PEY4_RHOML|nr:hypothetical protein RHMOL_Rhmol03G0128900 [Rhododendron molle]